MGQQQELTTQQINLMIDPEGTKIALTAPFPNISKFLIFQQQKLHERLKTDCFSSHCR
jgi:hypothetical protein